MERGWFAPQGCPLGLLLCAGCGRESIAHSHGQQQLSGREVQHIVRRACPKVGQNPSAVQGCGGGPSGDLRKELAWVLGKAPRLTALLAQRLSTSRGDGVRVIHNGELTAQRFRLVCLLLTRTRAAAVSAHGMHATGRRKPPHQSITSGGEDGGTYAPEAGCRCI